MQKRQKNLIKLLKLNYFSKWISISILISISIGLASALFLITLDKITNLRESTINFIYFLPLAGLLLAIIFLKFGKNIEGGNKLILQEYENPTKPIPLKMAPMIYIGTLISHLFGASVGREGTAVQMSASISDQLTKLFQLNKDDRKIIILCAIAAGFSAVFGTPFAGIIFSFELVFFRKVAYKAYIPVLICAISADYVCQLSGGIHTQYFISTVPQLNKINFFYTCIVGILFGLTAFLFIQGMKYCSLYSKKFIPNSPLKTFIGGLIIVFLILLIGDTKYIGLGIPSIVNSFTQQADYYDFVLKMLFTILALSFGFKGGEVTPLFFIGAVLGSFLSIFIPLPISLLAGIGFVAVFSGATKTPIACTIMGIELFGYEVTLFLFITCVISFFISGNTSIYREKFNLKNYF